MTTTTTTTYNKDIQLIIAGWRLDQIELALELDIELSDIAQICQSIVHISDDEIVAEYLS